MGHALFQKIAAEQGWDEATQIMMLLEFIKHHQDSPATFCEFLLEQQTCENLASGEGFPYPQVSGSVPPSVTLH